MPATVPSSPTTPDLLQRFTRAQALDPDARRSSIASAHARIASAPTFANRVEFALLATLPEAAPEVRAAAREGVRTCTEPGATDALFALCTLGSQLLATDADMRQQQAAWQARLHDAEARINARQQQLDVLSSQSQETQEAEAHRVALLERQLGEQSRQIAALRRQMRELQAIERSIERRRDGSKP